MHRPVGLVVAVEVDAADPDATADGAFQIAVLTVRRPVLTGRGRPTLTLRTCATASAPISR